MITPELSRIVAHWLLTSNAPTATRILIMEATSGKDATDEELLLALEATGVEGELIAAEWAGAQRRAGVDLSAAARPDVTELAMVAVYPRTEEQQALAVEGGNDPATMHVTLVFLGDAADVDEQAVAETLADIASVTAPLEGAVGGVGRFVAGEDGVPVIALPSVKGLAEFRATIADALAQQGIESPTEHGWTPHLTIQYVEEEGGELPAVPDVPLHFDSITFSRGDHRSDFPLEG